VTLRQYTLNQLVLNKMLKLDKDSCRVCKVKFNINDEIVSRSCMSSKMYTVYYHKKCAESVNII
jgi:hypothetical protein